MRRDDFERLMKLVDELEAGAKNKADEQMCEAIRCGIGIVERLVTALERIAANTKPYVASSQIKS